MFSCKYCKLVRGLDACLCLQLLPFISLLLGDATNGEASLLWLVYSTILYTHINTTKIDRSTIYWRRQIDVIILYYYINIHEIHHLYFSDNEKIIQRNSNSNPILSSVFFLLSFFLFNVLFISVDIATDISTSLTFFNQVS